MVLQPCTTGQRLIAILDTLVYCVHNMSHSYLNIPCQTGHHSCISKVTLNCNLQAASLQAGRLYLQFHARKVFSDTFTSHAINQFNLDFSLTFSQKLVTNPVLVGKVACAALVWVVLAQHALQSVAAMISASTQGASMSCSEIACSVTASLP